jgi:nucleotide-binding universal stress UspA family protein
LIATDGTLAPDFVTPFAAGLAGADGRVTVITVVEVNRNLLRDLRAIFGQQPPTKIDQDAEYVGLRTSASETPAGWPGDEEMITRYLEDQKDSRTAPLASALRAAGLKTEVIVREGEDPAVIIIDEIKSGDVDVVCLGATGQGIFEGLLGSTGTKLARRAPCPVLVMRSK